MVKGKVSESDFKKIRTSLSKVQMYGKVWDIRHLTTHSFNQLRGKFVELFRQDHRGPDMLYCFVRLETIHVKEEILTVKLAS